MTNKPGRKPKVPAAVEPVKTAPEGLEDLLDDDAVLDGEDGGEEEVPAGEKKPVDAPKEPEVPAGPKTRKQAAKEAEEAALADKAKKAGPKVVPTDDFIRDKKGNIKLDSDGDKERYAPGPHKSIGYVNENGVLFPVHYKFKGGHVGTFGNVVLLKCPICHHSNGIDQARVGICGNQKCNFSQVAELEEVEPK